MSGDISERKRLIQVTDGNIRQSHLYIRQHLDFFPSDVLGPPTAGKDLNGHAIHIQLEGLNETIDTDIPTDKNTGRPRQMFRRRSWVRKFFEHHKIKGGDILALQRTDERSYRLYPFHTKSKRCNSWRDWIDKPEKTNAPTVIELFAGCGGMALGFKQAGFKTILANEWDAAACETLKQNITDRVANCAIEEIERFPHADVVAGGPPCQGFSNLGERLPYDPRRQMWRHFMRAVEQAEPSVFVMENVPPLLKSQEFIEIKKIAENLGYKVATKVLNAADYGVPQTRKRAIVIGVRDGLPSHPDPTHFDPDRHNLLTHQLKPWVTVRDAIGDLPKKPTEENWHIGRNPTQMSLERYKSIPPGGNRFDLPKRLTPDCWIRKTKGGTDLMGRLWWDRPSVTIRTEFYKPEKGRYLHPAEHRPITHREAARLQGFPDDFEFCGKRIEVGVQIGNAVPPPLGHALAKHVLKLLGKKVEK